MVRQLGVIFIRLPRSLAPYESRLEVAFRIKGCFGSPSTKCSAMLSSNFLLNESEFYEALFQPPEGAIANGGLLEALGSQGAVHPASPGHRMGSRASSKSPTNRSMAERSPPAFLRLLLLRAPEASSYAAMLAVSESIKAFAVSLMALLFRDK